VTAKKNGNSDEGAVEEGATEQAASAEAPQLSIFDQARNANLRNAAEAAAGGERKAGREKTEHEATPYSLAFHPDGTEKRMVICRPDGSSEREVTVSEWDRMQANPNLPVGAWMVKFTEVIAPHHSDEIF
jgi:hypothetical protein